MQPDIDPSKRLNQVAAVVTAFRPTPHLVENVSSLLRQLTTVVVVDDGGGPGFDHIFDAAATAGALVLRLEENSGIASALNAGIELARTKPVDYIITVDQDSLLTAEYVRQLMEAAESAVAAGVTPGLVSPARIHGNPVKTAGSKSGVQLGREPIQSGLLIPVSTLDTIGNFWDGLFIDLVDTEYYFRALDAGLPTVLADAEFDHSLGSLVDANIWGKDIKFQDQTLKVRIAASWRYYYIFRNRILVGRRYAKVHPGWVAGGLLLDMRHLLLVTALAPGRAARLRSALRGTIDGIRGRSGKAHLG
ncbi:glycosyltransferase [Arthrobacter sp. FW306-04-A]|uniref:glycosyltransferase n=1 Tax=Arthrobacter sp. FW306-04-A TaxID=2879619 RepID=UPI0037BFF394|nr:glycosyltransferase [Arthrobacter sp. FW306-04-A]